MQLNEKVLNPLRATTKLDKKIKHNHFSVLEIDYRLTTM